MPRLSIYKPEKGDDYSFMDKNIREQFYVGGTDVHVHKYVGTHDQGASGATTDQPRYDSDSPLNIQDLLFLENRDRKYDQDVYVLRAIYNVQDIDFNMSQFGLFLQNDTLFVSVHLNECVDRLGRKIMSGDVLEFPHLKDEYSLDADIPIALKRFYVVEDVNRSAEGFSQTYYPHVLRIKAKSLVDSQEFKDILGNATEAGTLSNYMSSYNKELEISNAVLGQAEADSPTSGYSTDKFYVVPLDGKNQVNLDTVDETDTLGDASNKTVDGEIKKPRAKYYAGYLTGDGIPPNGAALAGFGLQFPRNPADGDYFLRTDYLPNRLFQYNGVRWVKIEDKVQTNMTKNDTNNTQKMSFVNNTKTTTTGGLTQDQRQALSKALAVKPDN
jgi:hypothetical protein